MKLTRISDSGLRGVHLLALTALVMTGLGLQPGFAASLPPSLAHSGLRELPLVTVGGAVDHQALQAEDEAASRTLDRPPIRFAVPFATHLTPATAGVWERLDDGSRLWRLAVGSPGATSLNLWLKDIHLPGGAALWIHDRGGAQVHGPYLAARFDSDHELWTPVVRGDEIVLELRVPAGSNGEALLDVARVHHGYRFFDEGPDAAKQGSCNIDVVCAEGDAWRDQIRSVARYTISGMYLCTGTLINNTAEDLRPLFLTADHCGVTSATAASTVFYWNYESPSCGMLAGGSLQQNQDGATFLASWAWDPEGSDFALIELDEIPAASFDVYFSGWDAGGAQPQGVVTIHHPSGDEKAISFEDDPLGTIWGTHWVIPDWDLGTTEQGSSGSCLFDAVTKRCIGTLSGGYASCSNLTGDDWYGKLSEGWDGDGSSSGRLRDYLDPLNSGATFVNGRNPSGGGTSFDNVWLLPAAASSPGYGSANWKSQIAIVNHTPSTRQANVYYVAGGQQWPGELLSGPHSIAPRATVYLDDPLLPENPTSGLVFVTMDQPGPLVSSRTFSLDPSGDTYGQGIPGIELAESMTPGTLILPLAQNNPGRFHSNLGLVQTGTASYAVQITVYSRTGTPLSQKTYTQSAAYRQINDVFADMGLGTQALSGAYLRAVLSGGSPAYWTAYLSVVDDLSHDPTYIAGVAP